MPATVSPLLLALIASLPWWLAPAILYARLRATPSLANVDPTAPNAGAPRVSVILPARNEAGHVGDCVRSVLSTTWPNLELVLVDDHSTDGTGVLAGQAAKGDARLTRVQAPSLPPGWFGKQWACHIGALQSTGSLLLFIDAETRHAPDLVARLVRARAERGAELMSVAGLQEMRTVWERVVQPCVFAMILLRYGGTQSIERATRAADVIANGQCFMISRDAYHAIGGHESVRDYVAEDLMMAQAVWSSGKRVSLVRGVAQLSTRMYDGLGSLINGWGKNVYAGGRLAMRGGAVGRLLYPVLLLAFPTALFLPFAMLAASAIAIAADIGRPAGPSSLGGLVLFVICAIAIVRGRNVRWKGRGYVTR